MNILGVSCHYHDAAAALLRDGVIVAAAEEERFTRIKHDQSFPIHAIRYCLESQGLRIQDVDYIGFYEKPLLKFERVLCQHLESFPRSYRTFVSSLPSWLNEKIRLRRTLRKALGYRGSVLFLEHHMAHAASAFLVSPFERAAILTVDGVGEWTTASYGIGEGTRIHLRKDIRFPHSLGLLYSTITAYLGFSVNNSEYKVMGLSAYGNRDRATNPFYARLRDVVQVREDGSLRLDMSYFCYHYAERMPSQKLCDLLGGPAAPPDSVMTPRLQDIAAAVQLLTEDVLCRMLCHLHRETGCDNLVMAGGVALNSVFNGKILRLTPFRRVWIQPNASDAGTSIGAAAYIYHTLLGRPRHWTLSSPYLGPSFSSAEIGAFLDQNGVRYQRLRSDEEIVETTARLVAEDHVVGWMQGRMEWGPRALGARSILANPLNPRMRDILNEKVKHRERFRPFAPVVCAEDADTYFECDSPLPAPCDFMLMVYPIRPAHRDRLPAVRHVDDSGRLQTIRRENNPLYYDTIRAFGRRTGVPMLVNTSFNIRGEPIVCTPLDAYRCMMGTGIDYLIMGDYCIRREDNPQHIWDSETYAKD
ncbi:MAG: carbamoyltransferase [Myxococcales bacterium]|nr:carbamoyltransferase [Myxococcota bacterium]MDW8283177.1 carbamoyltransferase [Myxococcales bacterium]